MSGVVAFQRKLVVMRISGRRLPVSVSVLIFFFIFELQSDFSVNMFHVSGYFCTVGFGVYETANIKILDNTWFYIIHGAS